MPFIKASPRLSHRISEELKENSEKSETENDNWLWGKSRVLSVKRET